MVEQLLVNALIAGSLYALVGVGFALIFRLVKFFHFTHGLTYAVGAYATFSLHTQLGMPLGLALITSVIIAAILGVLLDLVVFQPLRNRRASPLIALLASLGTYLVGQNVLSIIFGDDAKSIRSILVVPGISLFHASITKPQIVIVVSSLTVVLLTSGWLSISHIGKQIRAVANDATLAVVVGIPTRRVMLVTIAVGSGLAGLAGVLSALDRTVIPTMGMNALLLGIVAMIVGGKESVLGVSLGAYFLSVAQNLGVLWITAAWQDAIVFLILIAFLLLRPQGFLGHSIRKAAI